MTTTTPNKVKRFVFSNLRQGPNRWLGLCFFLQLFWLAPLNATTKSLLSPDYEKLDAGAMRPGAERLQRNPVNITAGDLLDAFFYKEFLDLTLQIHEARDLNEALGRSCTYFQEHKFESFKEGADRARTQLVCALHLTGDIESHSPWAAGRRLEEALSLYEAGTAEMTKAGKEAQADRFYVEGRLFQSLPATAGVGAGKSLVALQLLTRMEPTKTSPLYFLSRAYAQVGNRSAEKLWWGKATVQNDPRTMLVSRGDARVRRKLNDGLGFGFSSSLFFAPGADFGIAGGYHDDRLFDDDRAASASGSITTRGQFSAQAKYEDYEALAPSGISLTASVFRGEQDRFELGPHSRFESRYVPRVEKEEGRITLIQPFWDAFSLGLGWLWYHETVGYALNPGLVRALPDGEASYYSAPFFEMKWDSRNSDVVPTRGELVSLSGAFPTKDLLSPRSFEKWELRGETHISGLLFRGHTLSFFAVGGLVTGDSAPWSAYPRSDLPLRGVRQFRFQDRSLVGASAEYQLPVGYGFGLSLFGTALSVGPRLSDALGGAYEPGYGGGLTWASSQKVSSSWKILISRMGGETLFIASGGLSI